MVTASWSSRRPPARAPVVADGIAAKGWDVRVVEAYRTAARRAAVRGARGGSQDSDAILFTSASTVSSFVSAAGADGVPPVVVCIGPVTAEAAADLRRDA